MKKVEYPLLEFSDRADWHDWLILHHSNHKGLWMLYYKKHTQGGGIAYNEALDEALCYGWIDSLIRKINADCYARLFTPRINTAKWSVKNIERARQLFESGRIAESGMAAMDQEVKNELKRKSGPSKQNKDPEMPDALRTALEKEPLALLHFTRMAPSFRRNYILWISQAKRAETIERRVEEAIALLKDNKKLGLK